MYALPMPLWLCQKLHAPHASLAYSLSRALWKNNTCIRIQPNAFSHRARKCVYRFTGAVGRIYRKHQRTRKCHWGLVGRRASRGNVCHGWCGLCRLSWRQATLFDGCWHTNQYFGEHRLGCRYVWLCHALKKCAQRYVVYFRRQHQHQK